MDEFCLKKMSSMLSDLDHLIEGTNPRVQSIPNMTVLAPCDPEEMRLATTWCATESMGPVYMRLGKAGEPDLTSDAVDPFEIHPLQGDGEQAIAHGVGLEHVIQGHPGAVGHERAEPSTRDGRRAVALDGGDPRCGLEGLLDVWLQGLPEVDREALTELMPVAVLAQGLGELTALQSNSTLLPMQ